MPIPTTRPTAVIVSVLFFLCSYSGAQSVRPLRDRIDAIVDHELVVPVSVEDPERIGERGVRTRLDDGRELDARLILVRPRPHAGAAPAWTSAPLDWGVVEPSAWSDSRDGSWLLLVDLPVDAVGQGIWIQGTRYEPNWLPDPKRVILEARSRDDSGFWDAALAPALRDAPMVARAIERLRADPLRRWRADLMTLGFSPERADRSAPSVSERDLGAIFAELERDDERDTLGRVSRHIAARWRLILGRVWLIDPRAAQRLKDELTRTVGVGSTHIPLWSDDRPRLEALAHDLLSPYVDDALRVERVGVWLDAQPRTLAWVIDDAGYPPRDARALTPEIGLILTRAAREPVSVRIGAPGAAPTLERVTPNTVASVRAAHPIERAFAHETIETHAPLRLGAGRDAITRRVQNVVPSVAPPGAAVGPLVRDWTLEAMRRANPAHGALPAPAERTTGLLTRLAPPGESDHRIGWRLHLETGAPDPEEPVELRVWIGARGLPRAVWTFSSRTGLIGSRVDPDVPGEPVHRDALTGSRWSLSIDLPPEAIDESGILLLGIERTRAGVRSAWPRRMTPWSDEPGRAALDLSAWIGTR